MKGKLIAKTTLFFILILQVDKPTLADVKQSTNKVVFACSELPDNIKNYFKSIYETAFAELDMEFSIVNLGLARAVIEAEKGNVDGLCGKTELFENLPVAKELIKVPVPVITSEVSLWALKKDSRMLSKASQKSQYIVAHQRGSIASELYISKYGLKNVITTWSKMDAVELLLNGRVDMIIAGDLFIIEVNGSEINIELVRVSEPERLQMFPFIHRRFEQNLSSIEAAVKKATYEYQYLKKN